MQVRESVRMAFSSIGSNRLRASLTLLSIAIGVFAIVGVAAAVGALNAKLNDQLASLGSTSYQIVKQPSVNFSDNRRRFRNRKDITLRQGLALRSRLVVAQAIALTNFTLGAVVKFGEQSTDPNITIAGGDESFLTSFDFNVIQGRGIDAQDVQLRSDVVVLGADIYTRLFRDQASVLGKAVTINGHRYVVIGMLEPKGAIFGQSQDAQVLIPITSSAKYFFDEWGTSVRINIRAKDVSSLDETIGQSVGIMRDLRHVALGDPNDFEIETNASISDTFGSLTLYISWFGLGCGIIALAAAGVGIMNIMLVSVKERTREIGIRKAVGATSGDILSQFMVEAVTLCQLGALIGIVLGLLGGLAMSALIKVTPPVPWAWLGISIGACTLVGLAFGIYPAWKASRLDPIDALRYE